MSGKKNIQDFNFWDCQELGEFIYYINKIECIRHKRRKQNKNIIHHQITNNDIYDMINFNNSEIIEKINIFSDLYLNIYFDIFDKHIYGGEINAELWDESLKIVEDTEKDILNEFKKREFDISMMYIKLFKEHNKIIKIHKERLIYKIFHTDITGVILSFI